MTRKASLLFALYLLGGAPSFAADAPTAPNRFTSAAAAPAERFEIKGVLVERHGTGARSLILIPGLATGGWVWQETAREFAATHTVYVLTLPGFDGRPAVDGDPFEAAHTALRELMLSRRLVKPVLVGHSLGGTLGIAVAAAEPGRVGGVVSVDGLPVFPRTEDLPPEQRAAMAEGMRRQVAGLDAPAFAAQQRRYMRATGMVDIGKADDAALLTARSSPGAVGAWMAAVLARDLRPRLASIAAPVLLVVPSYTPDLAVQGIGAADKLAYYRELMTGTKRLEMASIDNARHFAMIDQPRAFNEALRQFLNGLSHSF